MNADNQATRWRRELIGWTLRGSLCAFPSLVWACILGFVEPNQILAMLLIITLFVIGFSWVSVELIENGKRHLAKALKIAVWLKVILSIGNLGFGVPDMWFGVISTNAISYLRGGNGDIMGDGRGVTFGWTAAITTSQGLLLTLLIVVLTFGVLGWKWLFKFCSQPASGS